MDEALLPVAILAGGLGTRLLPLTQNVPKAMVPVSGRPFVDHLLALLRAAGAVRVVLCVNHLGAVIEEHVGDGAAHGLDVRYSYDGSAQIGTGGAINNALPLLGKRFLVVYGDSYLDCDCRAVQATFQRAGARGLMTIFRNDGAIEPSNVLALGERIVRYDKVNRTADMHHIDYGLSAFDAAAFDGVSSTAATDLGTIFQALIAREQLLAFEVATRFHEIGTVDGIAELERFLASRPSA